MSVVSNIQAMSSGVDTLTEKVNKLHAAVASLGDVASSGFGAVNAQLQGGGQRGVGQGNTNMMFGSLGSFSTQTPNATAMGGADTMGKTNAVGGTSTGLNKYFDRAAASMSPYTGGGNGGNGGTTTGAAGELGGGSPGATGVTTNGSGMMSLVTGIAQVAMAPLAGAYGATMDPSGIVNRAGSYFQAANRSPGLSRNSLERATFSALSGGMTGVGSDAQVANILSNAGYVPGSQDYLKTVAQVKGAAINLGMPNANAAQALSTLGSGSMGANLYQYGITTIDNKGNSLSPGAIAQQVYSLLYPNGTTTNKVQNDFKNGNLSGVMQGFGFTGDLGNIMQQSLVDIAAGKNPDLASQKNNQGNQNPFSPLYQMNQSQTGIQQGSEANTLSGLQTAADFVTKFNNAMAPVIESLAKYRAMIDGTAGTNVGKGIKAFAGTLWSGIQNIFTGLQSGAAAAAAAAGGTVGYGGSFGGKGGGTPGIGGGTPATSMGGTQVTAGYGAQDPKIWAGTGGEHKGTDFGVPVGTAVYATKDGIVSGETLSSDYGQAVIIDHGDGYQTVYAHLSNKEVSPGTSVTKGQEIGKSGSSGNATGPHLHYEVRKGYNNPVDPASFSGAGDPLTSNMGMNSVTGTVGYSDVLMATPTLNGTSGGTGTPADVQLPAMPDATLLDTLKKAGFTGNELAVAYGVAKAESGGRPTAYNPPSNGTGDNSFGLFQINMIGGLEQERLNKTWVKSDGSTFKLSSDKDLYDPLTNAEVAYHMSNGGKNWSAWTTYTSGKYQQFLDKKKAGGGTAGYGANMPEGAQASTAAATISNLTSPTTAGGTNVNIYLTVSQASDSEAIMLAKRVKTIIDESKHVSMIGNS